MSSGRRRGRRRTLEDASQGNQLFRRCAENGVVVGWSRDEGGDVVSSCDSASPSASHIDGDILVASRLTLDEPPVKRRRMLVSKPSVKSVGQRLKEASLKDGPASSSVVSSDGGVFKTPCGAAPAKKQQPQHPPLTPRTRNAVRVIAQYLRDLGFHDTVDQLVEESGCRVETRSAIRLRECVLRGLWNDALLVLAKSRGVLTPEQIENAAVTILHAKFYYLIFHGETAMALKLLREDFPNRSDLRRKRARMVDVLFMEAEEARKVPEVLDVFKRSSRRRMLRSLQKDLPPAFMLPPNRIEQILDQGTKIDQDGCPHASQPQKPPVPDHIGNYSTPPLELPREKICYSKQVQAIQDFHGEVWVVQFSPQGRYVAAGSRKVRLCVYRVSKREGRLKPFRDLRGSENVILDAVGGLSWSTDEQLLAICGTDEKPFDVIIYNVQEGRVFRTIINPQGSLISCVSFFRDNTHRFVAGDLRGHMHIFDMDRSEDLHHMGQWDGFRIRGLYGSKDGKSVIAADTHNRVRQYSFSKRVDETLFVEESAIMTFVVHPTERYIVVATKKHGLRMWDMSTRHLLRNFSGSHHGEHVIHPCFGGIRGDYLATGSEDRRVVVWNVDESMPLMRLKGHAAMVNAVSWSPVDPSMFVSASDDGTVRVWVTHPHTPSKLLAPRPGSQKRRNSLDKIRRKKKLHPYIKHSNGAEHEVKELIA